MIKRLLVVGAVALFMAGMTGCSKDCEVCVDLGDLFGGPQCAVKENVKKSECEECGEAIIGADGVEAKNDGLPVTCKVK